MVRPSAVVSVRQRRTTRVGLLNGADAPCATPSPNPTTPPATLPPTAPTPAPTARPVAGPGVLGLVTPIRLGSLSLAQPPAPRSNVIPPATAAIVIFITCLVRPLSSFRDWTLGQERWPSMDFLGPLRKTQPPLPWP